MEIFKKSIKKNAVGPVDDTVDRAKEGRWCLIAEDHDDRGIWQVLGVGDVLAAGGVGGVLRGV